MKKITTIQPLLFENYLLIVLDGDWVRSFNAVPTIDAFLDEQGHLCMVSKEVVQK